MKDDDKPKKQANASNMTLEEIDSWYQNAWIEWCEFDQNRRTQYPKYKPLIFAKNPRKKIYK